MQTINATISLGRVTSGRGDYISLSLKDEESRVTFATVKMDAETLGKVITGLSEQKVTIEVKGLDRVGKARVVEDRTLSVPGHIYSKESLEKLVKSTCQEDGWVLDTYLGSKDSVQYLRDDTTLVRYKVYRFEELK
jgi:hypothetical protein